MGRWNLNISRKLEGYGENMKNIKKITKIAEALDWSIEVDGNEVELIKYSPAGQDFHVSLTADNMEELTEKLEEMYNDFDCSEEAYIWLDNTGHGANGAPYDMKDVYEDMEAHEKMIEELIIALSAA